MMKIESDELGKDCCYENMSFKELVNILKRLNDQAVRTETEITVVIKLH